MSAFQQARRGFGWLNEMFPVLLGGLVAVGGIGEMLGILPPVPSLLVVLAGIELAMIASAYGGKDDV